MVKHIFRTVVAFAVVAGSFTSARADAGDWWCPHSFDWTGQERIEVWIHPDLPGQFRHADGTLWGAPELLYEVLHQLERIMDQAPTAMPPLKFMGWEPSSTPWWAWADTDGITLRPQTTCGDEMYKPIGGVPGSGAIIAFAQDSCNFVRAHTGPDAFGGVLNHELIHALGFRHWGECQADPPICTDNPGEPQICGSMQNHGLKEDWIELEASDFNGLLSTYGVWEFDGNFRRESSDGLNWSSLGGSGIRFAPYAASGWSGGTTVLPIAVRAGNGLDPKLWTWTYDSYTSWGKPYTWGAQIGQMATAYDGSARYMSFLNGQWEWGTSKGLRWSRHTSPTSSSTITSSRLASRQGHTMTYDPQSERFVHVWRNYDKQIMLALSDGQNETLTPVELSGLAYASPYTPSVACGPASIGYNCILVWESSGEEDHYHLLSWAQFYVTSFDVILFASWATTQNYLQNGPPAVTYKEAPSGGSFVVGYKAIGGDCFFTLTKGTSYTATFGNLRSHCGPTGAHIGPPIVGSIATNKVEAWADYNMED